jgi:hypothetical protein
MDHASTAIMSNAGPREEVVRLKYGGITVPKAVDTSPQRCVDTALMFIAKGAACGILKKAKTAGAAPSDEIISCRQPQLSRATQSTTRTVLSAWQKRRDKPFLLFFWLIYIVYTRQSSQGSTERAIITYLGNEYLFLKL